MTDTPDKLFEPSPLIRKATEAYQRDSSETPFTFDLTAKVPKDVLASLTPEQITAALMAMTPEKKAAIQAAATQAGINPESANLTRLRDGGIKLTVTLPPEVAEPLSTWAESANEDLFNFLHQQIVVAITGYVFQDYGGGEPAVTDKAALPTAPTVATSTAA